MRSQSGVYPSLTHRGKDTVTGSVVHSVRWVMVQILAFVFSVNGQNRFPRPEFQGDYTMPSTTFPSADPAFFSYIDVGVLILALVCAAWFALKLRSRRALFWLTLFSVVYFGFYRLGCICPIGAIQNVSLGLFNAHFVIPLAVILFFLLPLLFALFFGRVFCAAVCPLGAIQDLFAVKPVSLPRAITVVLRLLPHLYLGAGVLFAATGAGFIICKFDPFIGIFRLSGPPGAFALGALFLGVGIFIARPYCRFLCPYGVLLGWASVISRKHLTITPDTCIQCRLCEDSCPFDVIQKPNAADAPKEPREQSVKRIVVLTMLLPVLVAAGGLTGYLSGDMIALVHPRVQLAERIKSEERGSAEGLTMESEAFRSGTQTVPSLVEEASAITRRMRRGSTILGIYLGIVVAAGVFRYALQWKRKEYIPDTQHCLSCGRCISYCPQEHRRLKEIRDKKGGSNHG